MDFKKLPELTQFLSTSIADGDPDADEQSTHAFAATSPAREQVITQLRLALASSELSLEELGTLSNRWFGDTDEARTWLARILSVLEAGSAAAKIVVVKDSNGTVLAEGDSVTVIKDLKVKGGSSDLKRGTTIKKIHLIDDAENIECRVDGSTLVLKTCFLKKG
ncbi:MAG: alkylphosphonate utilization protein [Oligoflexia bacterium]|nr:alkylphosphonate utilization protein [Oligoflexia bacterium]